MGCASSTPVQEHATSAASHHAARTQASKMNVQYLQVTPEYEPVKHLGKAAIQCISHFFDLPILLSFLFVLINQRSNRRQGRHWRHLEFPAQTNGTGSCHKVHKQATAQGSSGKYYKRIHNPSRSRRWT
jgi:hypothetical protein